MESKIELKEGLEIGYNSTLARVEDAGVLGEGTHYLLARNGRGKTTLLRSLASVLKLRNGSYSIGGKVQFVPEDIYYNGFLTPLAIFKCLLPRQQVAPCLEFADKIELNVKKAYRELSTGNKRKVSWLMAEFSCLENEANVLLLDEPFTGVDSFVRDAFMEYWEHHSTGVCRLVSCHPDFDSMSIDSSVLISEGVISLNQSEVKTSWGALKESLA